MKQYAVSAEDRIKFKETTEKSLENFREKYAAISNSNGE